MKHSVHESAISALFQKYSEQGKLVLTNPGEEKNSPWKYEFIDIIVLDKEKKDEPILIKIETKDTIMSKESIDDWKKYDKVYPKWNMVVPFDSVSEAYRITEIYQLKHCKITFWLNTTSETFSFFGLPELNPDELINAKIRLN